MTRFHSAPEKLSASQTVMSRLPSIPCHRTLTKGAFATKRQKKKGAYAPLFLQASDASVSLEMLDKENSPLTSPSAVTGLADTARLFRRVHPCGSKRRLLRLRTNLLEKHSMPSPLVSRKRRLRRWKGKKEHLDVPTEPCEAWCLCDTLDIARRRLPGPCDLFSL